jgi:hypothetical protein
VRLFQYFWILGFVAEILTIACDMMMKEIMGCSMGNPFRTFQRRGNIHFDSG